MNLEYAKARLLRYAGIVKAKMLVKNNVFYLDIVDEMMNALADPTAEVSISQLQMFYEFLDMFYYAANGNEDIRIKNYKDVKDDLQENPRSVIINQVLIELADLCKKNIKILGLLSIASIDSLLDVHQTVEIHEKLITRKEILEKILKGLNENSSPDQLDEVALILMVTDLDISLLNLDVSDEFFVINDELSMHVNAIFSLPVQLASNNEGAVEQSIHDEEISWCEWFSSLFFRRKIHPEEVSDYHVVEVVEGHNHFPVANVSTDEVVVMGPNINVNANHYDWQVSDVL